MTSVAIERRHRMTEVWHAGEPSELDIALARQRFELGRRRGPRLSLGAMLRWGAVGALAGVATMLLLGRVAPSPAAIEAERGALAPTAEPAATVEAPPKPAPRRPPPSPRERPAQHRLRPRIAAPPAPSASAAPAAEAETARDTDALKRAGRWISIGRGSQAMPIVVGLDKDGSAPEQAEQLEQTAPPPK